MANKRRDDSKNGKFVHVKGDIYKIPYRRQNGMPGNFYFRKTKCYVCGKKMFQWKNKSKMAVCGRVCQNALRIAPEGSKKCRRGFNNGSVLIKVSGHPNNRKGWVLEHRLIVEKYIKRYLKPAEKVHHIDMDQRNNKIRNLYVCENNKAHNLCHASLNKCVKKLLMSKILRFNKKKGIYET